MNKKILITGINGFIGQSCKFYFQKLGFDVFGIALHGLSTDNVIIGEVSKKNLKILNQKFDIIFHLAGSGTVSMAQNAPQLERIKSIYSTEQILNYVIHNNKNALLIFSSSAAVYGNDYDRPIKENDILKPISVYGNHKLEAEKLCKYYAENYDLNIKIVRIFSVYGNGLKKQLLWDFTNRAIVAKNEIICFGSGKERRDFIHILDLLDFFLILTNQSRCFDIYNCASGIAISIENIMKNVLQELNIDIALKFNNMQREGNPTTLIANIDKAKHIGFNPKINIKDGLKEYVKWFKNI